MTNAGNERFRCGSAHAGRVPSPRRGATRSLGRLASGIGEHRIASGPVRGMVSVAVSAVLVLAVGGSCNCPVGTTYVFDGGWCFAYTSVQFGSSSVRLCGRREVCNYHTTCATAADCLASPACTFGATCGEVVPDPPACDGHGWCQLAPATDRCMPCWPSNDGGFCDPPAVCFHDICVLPDGGDLVDRCTIAKCSVDAGCAAPACALLATCGPAPRCRGPNCEVPRSDDGGCARCDPARDAGCPGDTVCTLGYCVCLQDGGCSG